MALGLGEDDSGLSDILCTERFSDFDYLGNDIIHQTSTSHDFHSTSLQSSDANYHAFLPNGNDGQLYDVLGNFDLQNSDGITQNCGHDNMVAVDTSDIGTAATLSGQVSFESPNKSTDHGTYSSDSAIDSEDHMISNSVNAACDSDFVGLSSVNTVGDVSMQNNCSLDSSSASLRLGFTHDLVDTDETTLDGSVSLMDISNSDIFNPAHNATSNTHS